MSDTINTLIGAQRSASVLDRIANPPQINPLAGIQAGAEAAKMVQGVRGLAAHQAWGEALAGATDPQTGVVDYPKALRTVAGDSRGPLAMPEATEGASARMTEQLALAHRKLGWYQAAVGALSDDSTREHVLAMLKSGLASGILTAGEVAKEASMIPTNPAEMPAYIQQHRLTASTAEEQTGLLYGAQGLTARDLAQPFAYVDANKQTVNTTLGGYLQKLNLIPHPGQPTPPPPAPAPAPAAAPAPRAAAALPAPATSAPPPLPTGPLPTGYRPPGAPAPVVPLQPVVQAPATTPSAGVTVPRIVVPSPGPPRPGAEAVPAPAPGAAPSILARLNPIGSAAAAPYPSVGELKGPGPQVEPDIAAYNEAAKAVPDQQRNLTAGESALEALDLASSGPGTSTVNRWKSFMIAQGIPGWEALDTGSTEAYQLARKNLLRFAQGNGGKVGTDLGLATQLESNPNVEALLKGTNRHILVQDIGLARQRMAQTLIAPPGGIGKTDFGNGMADHVRNFTPNTDWHAFSWDLMNGEERQAYYDTIKDKPKLLDKWKKSMEVARTSGVWSRPPETAAAPAAAAPGPRPQPVPAGPPPRVNLLTPQ